MLETPGLIHIVLGMVGIFVGVFYLTILADRKTYRWLTLLGYLMLVVGVMTSGIVNFWIGITIFASWFFLAAYFLIKERKK